MSEAIKFIVTGGRLLGQEFIFREKVSLIIGRQDDCGLILPDSNISRRHCVLDVDPPFVRVRDNGSSNGSYLNGRLIGRGKKGGPAVEMWDGDRLGLGRECELTLSSPLGSEWASGLIEGYQAIGFLGQGAKGQVWRVREKASGKQFALKLVPLLAQPGARAKEMLLREADLAGQLDHPNIVRQFTSGESGDLFYILQEVCEGDSLEEWLNRQGGRPLSLETATHIIFQILDALDYIHRAPVGRGLFGRKKKGMVHRDIHPGNILRMDDTDRPLIKVGDFGLSKIFEMSGWSGPTRPGEFAGALEFMSREQILRYKKAKPRVDVWAAAATYYCLLTGRPPKDLSRGEKWQLALALDAEPIRRVNKGIPAELAEVIDAALKEDPEIGCQEAMKLKSQIVDALRKIKAAP